MKIKAELTVAIGQYENIKPVVEIDTDDLENSLREIEGLREAIHEQMVETRSAVGNDENPLFEK